MRRFPPGLSPLLAVLAVLAVRPAPARAQAGGDDPYRYDLRSSLFPAVFVAGLTQRSFGSALRAELDVGPRLTFELGGVLPWVVVGGQDQTGTFTASAGLSLHVFDRVELEPLEGTVHPKDYAAPTGRGNVGTDSDLTTPVSSRMGGPALHPPEHASSDATGPVRHTHSIRVGYHLGRTVQRGRPNDVLNATRYALNTVHALYLGYGFGQAWNLSPATVGERELGYRRFYLDALLTLSPLVDAELLAPQTLAEGDVEPRLLPIGARMGMQGALDALVRSAPGLGFAYNLELSVLPGRSGLEGRLLIALGIELDASTKPVSTR
jgi:hypothetical protein